jgi:hypothetical protein
MTTYEILNFCWLQNMVKDAFFLEVFSEWENLDFLKENSEFFSIKVKNLSPSGWKLKS